MRVIIEDGQWGDGSLMDRQAVLDNVVGLFLSNIQTPAVGQIIAVPKEGVGHPKILYRDPPYTSPITVWISARNTLWAKLAYQFAHELCHAQSDFERLRDSRNKWFHESLCELASIFTLLQMGASWVTDPPLARLRFYAQSLSLYAQELIDRPSHQPPLNRSMAEWLSDNEESLRSNPIQRDLNGIVAVKLLPLFRENPNYWQAIRCLPDTDELFLAYVDKWEQQSREEERGLMRNIRAIFARPSTTR